MDVYNHIIETNIDTFKYFPKNNICFLDIETTGFSRKYNEIYLIGLIYYNKKEGTWNLVQLFANTLDEEKEILNFFNDLISDFELLVSYNGDAFDIPFLKSRMKYYNIQDKISSMESFDIYREIKANDSYLDFENLKLKTIERNLGIYREDQYSGKDCIDFYLNYTSSYDMNLKDNILKHNYDDLYYLLEIVKIFDFLDDVKNISIDFNENKLCIQILDIVINGNLLNINCETTSIGERTNIIHYGEAFNFRWQNNTSLIVDLGINEGWITPTKKALYIEKSKLGLDNMVDLSPYMVPNDLILLKVEKKWVMKNIKNIITELLLNMMKLKKQ